MKTKEQRVNNIIGQLQGVKKMMEEGKDCFQTLVQLKAAKSALNSLMVGFIEEQFRDCLKKSSAKTNQTKLKRIFLETIKSS